MSILQCSWSFLGCLFYFYYATVRVEWTWYVLFRWKGNKWRYIANLPQACWSKSQNDQILYLDANNLYGWAISQAFPTGGFEWLTKKEIQEFDLKKNKKQIQNKDAIGYFLEVDLEYLTLLHDYYNEYPLEPESVQINKDYLSSYAKEMFINLGGCSAKKLLTTLNDKEKFVLHYRNLELYRSLGLKLKKIHKAIIKFNQENMR